MATYNSHVLEGRRDMPGYGHLDKGFECTDIDHSTHGHLSLFLVLLECLEEMGCLIARYGTSVCQPTAAKALPVVAQNIGDRDSTVRTAALNALVEVYRLEGDKIYKLVGQVR